MGRPYAANHVRPARLRHLLTEHCNGWAWTGVKWVGTRGNECSQARPFCNLAFPGLKECFSVGMTFSGRNDSFIIHGNSRCWATIFALSELSRCVQPSHYCSCRWLAGRNVNDIIAAEIFQWTSQCEFGQDNGLTRNTGARCKNKRDPLIFTAGPGIFLPFPLP